MHVPKNADIYHPVPQMNMLTISSNYLMLKPGYTVNPFVGLGFGLFQIDDLAEPICQPAELCFDEGGPDFEDEIMKTFTLNSGLYVTIIPNIAVKGDAVLFKPLGSTYKGNANGKLRFAYSMGLSFRF